MLINLDLGKFVCYTTITYLLSLPSAGLFADQCQLLITAASVYKQSLLLLLLWLSRVRNLQIISL